MTSLKNCLSYESTCHYYSMFWPKSLNGSFIRSRVTTLIDGVMSTSCVYHQIWCQLSLAVNYLIVTEMSID